MLVRNSRDLDLRGGDDFGSRSCHRDARLQKAYRFQKGGWTYVHLEGSPADIGFQHGYLLAPEISDALEAIKLFDTRETQRDWAFFRTTARQILWPHIDTEYQQELQGIAEGPRPTESISMSTTSWPSTRSKRCRTITFLG